MEKSHLAILSAPQQINNIWWISNSQTQTRRCATTSLFVCCQSHGICSCFMVYWRTLLLGYTLIIHFHYPINVLIALNSTISQSTVIDLENRINDGVIIGKSWYRHGTKNKSPVDLKESALLPWWSGSINIGNQTWMCQWVNEDNWMTITGIIVKYGYDDLFSPTYVVLDYLIRILCKSHHPTRWARYSCWCALLKEMWLVSGHSLLLLWGFVEWSPIRMNVNSIYRQYY